MKTLKAPQEEFVEQVKAPDRELVKKVVGLVMNQLGLPPGWTHTKAVNIFENRWRVNVYAAEPGGSDNLVVRLNICDSFYVILEDDGAVVASDTGVKDGSIIKKYGGAK